MATVDIVDLGDYVEVYPITHRDRHTDAIGYGSVRTNAGDPPWPPEDDATWKTGEFSDGKIWVVHMSEDVDGNLAFNKYFEADFAGEWSEEWLSITAQHLHVVNFSLVERAQWEGWLWFDCSGLSGAFSRVDLITEFDMPNTYDSDDRSVTVDYVTQEPIAYDNGTEGEIYMPGNWSGSGSVGSALNPTLIDLTALVDGGLGNIPDDEDPVGARAAWPLTGQALAAALAGGAFALRFRLIPDDTAPTGRNILDMPCRLDLWDTWVAAGRNMSDVEDVQYLIPRLRFYRGGAVNISATMNIPMSITARVRSGPGRGTNTHRARLIRDARRG